MPAFSSSQSFQIQSPAQHCTSLSDHLITSVQSVGTAAQLATCRLPNPAGLTLMLNYGWKCECPGLLQACWLPGNPSPCQVQMVLLHEQQERPPDQRKPSLPTGLQPDSWLHAVASAHLCSILPVSHCLVHPVQQAMFTQESESYGWTT